MCNTYNVYRKKKDKIAELKEEYKVELEKIVQEHLY